MRNKESGMRNNEWEIRNGGSKIILHSAFCIPHSSLIVSVERKAIKHTHLSVFPPDARVHVSAPLDLSEADLRSFLVSKVPWLRKQIAAVLAQPRQARREYESGEDVYLLGKRYRLSVRKGDEAASVRLEGKSVVLSGRGLETRAAREARIGEWYREELKQKRQKQNVVICPHCKKEIGGYVQVGSTAYQRVSNGCCPHCGSFLPSRYRIGFK